MIKDWGLKRNQAIEMWLDENQDNGHAFGFRFEAFISDWDKKNPRPATCPRCKHLRTKDSCACSGYAGH
jgi:hypothetical protein